MGNDRESSEFYMREQVLWREGGGEPERYKEMKYSKNEPISKIMVFVGPPMSGKTREARRLSNFQQGLWIDGRNVSKRMNNEYWLRDFPVEGKCIVIDDVPNKQALEKLLTFFDSDLTIIRKNSKKAFRVRRPQIIITCAFNEYRPHNVFVDRIKVVEFKRKEVHNG